MNQRLISLPLLEAMSEWHGLVPSGAAAPPEPVQGQGDYAQTEKVSENPSVPEGTCLTGCDVPVELLAPAGGPEAAIAALAYGADAIYAGLKKFSARAEAENFTLEELAQVVKHAHSLSPPRRVLVAINTLIQNNELPELVETLAALEAMSVDALLVQDLGVYALVREHFPSLSLHASTQLAVHNRAGVEVLAKLGFARVVLARELTLEEVREITHDAPIETEVFVHGALCYSYSGLCLFSSQTLGRSGNRGKCAYSCRDTFSVTGAPDTLRDGSTVKRDPKSGLPFSMKDLALPDHLPSLWAAGVSCFKIEGRKKSPLHVAAVTDFYRQLIDGTLSDSDRSSRESDLQAAFGRPWTQLFMESHRDKEVADRDLAHHRGVWVGVVEAVHQDRRRRWVRFRTSRSLEKGDGLQIDLPGQKSLGFGVRRMRMALGNERLAVTVAPVGSLMEVALPQDHRAAPEIPIGSTVYCTYSHAVRRNYPLPKPLWASEQQRRWESLPDVVGDRSLAGEAGPIHWGVKVDRVEYLDAFVATDWEGVDEVIVDIARDSLSVIMDRIASLAQHRSRVKVRLALPAVTRKWEEGAIRNKVARLREAGWRQWEVSNLSGWKFLELNPLAVSDEVDLATDWPVYVLNRLAARKLLAMGVTRFTLSPEDGVDNIRPMLAEFGAKTWVIVYQDTPLFQAESCAYANLIGGCPGKAACQFESMEMISSHGERVTALDYHCRTIVLNQGPFCLSSRLAELASLGARYLRMDFVFRPYTAEQAVSRWRAVRTGEPVPGGHAGNFERGIL